MPENELFGFPDISSVQKQAQDAFDQLLAKLNEILVVLQSIERKTS